MRVTKSYVLNMPDDVSATTMWARHQLTICMLELSNNQDDDATNSVDHQPVLHS